MAIKVHGAPVSTCTARVLACLLEKGVEYEFIPIDFAAGTHKQQSFLSLNPFGLVPVLEDGDLILFESRAITRYVADKHKDEGPDLLGSSKDPIALAAVDTWMEVEAHQFNGPISGLVYQIVVNPFLGMDPDEEQIRTHLEKLEKVLDVYEERLQETKYLAGDFYSLADLHHIPYLLYLMRTPMSSLIISRPHVKAWWEKVSSRPASLQVSPGLNLS
ncbi:hypothetical protein H6P81_015094 [Aristolochia fimbriata]|uniref:glutathione transferase n=1 Tax=Aristolochia fimbriata TaxID=158543 RepID=A0AAV7E6D4_ARIFI|nr:hypothetical protein H6P81_015094 [Aristolochia fimbriata]